VLEKLSEHKREDVVGFVPSRDAVYIYLVRYVACRLRIADRLIFFIVERLRRILPQFLHHLARTWKMKSVVSSSSSLRCRSCLARGISTGAYKPSREWSFKYCSKSYLASTESAASSR